MQGWWINNSSTLQINLYFSSVEDQMVTIQYMYLNILADANDPTLYVHIVVSFFSPLTALLPITMCLGAAQTHLGAAHTHVGSSYARFGLVTDSIET
jgi:hypothetical protein